MLVEDAIAPVSSTIDADEPAAMVPVEDDAAMMVEDAIAPLSSTIDADEPVAMVPEEDDVAMMYLHAHELDGLCSRKITQVVRKSATTVRGKLHVMRVGSSGLVSHTVELKAICTYTSDVKFRYRKSEHGCTSMQEACPARSGKVEKVFGWTLDNCVSLPEVLHYSGRAKPMPFCFGLRQDFHLLGPGLHKPPQHH